LADDTSAEKTALLSLTADIVAAYVQNNATPVTGLPDLISSVNSALSALITPIAAPEPVQTPAVNPKKSVFPGKRRCGTTFREWSRSVRLPILYWDRRSACVWT
jgi:predicted transcriptional regulator